MEYFSNNRKEDIKNKKNPSKIYIPLNTNRVNSNSKQLGSGFPDSKTIEFFSTVNRGIQTGLITVPLIEFIEITTSSYSILDASPIYHVTSNGSTLTIQTSVISDGNIFRIKDATGNASVNNIVIQTQGAELIDGDAAGVTINTDYGYVELYCFNNNLFIKQ